MTVSVFSPSSFNQFWFQPSGEGFTPPPTPALENPPLSREERKEKEVEVCVCSGVVLAAFNLKMEA